MWSDTPLSLLFLHVEARAEMWSRNIWMYVVSPSLPTNRSNDEKTAPSRGCFVWAMHLGEPTSHDKDSAALPGS